MTDEPQFRFQHFDNVVVLPKQSKILQCDLLPGEKIDGVRVIGDKLKVAHCDEGKVYLDLRSNNEVEFNGPAVVPITTDVAVRIQLVPQRQDNEVDSDKDLLELEDIERPAVLYSLTFLAKEADWPKFKEALAPLFALIPDAQRFEQNKQEIR